jgi:hypothetical protein
MRKTQPLVLKVPKKLKPQTLADQYKLEFIASIWDKYTLEQLEEKLK